MCMKCVHSVSTIMLHPIKLHNLGSCTEMELIIE